MPPPLTINTNHVLPDHHENTSGNDDSPRSRLRATLAGQPPKEKEVVQPRQLPPRQIDASIVLGAQILAAQDQADKWQEAVRKKRNGGRPLSGRQTALRRPRTDPDLKKKKIFC